MKDFLKVIKRYASPYKGYFFSSAILNILGHIAGVFSFAMIIPVLRILFGLQETDVVSRMEMPETETVNEYFSVLSDVLQNNFNYFVVNMMNNDGATKALIILALLLVGMTTLKTGLSYLGSFAIIPLRSGIVRDLRNQLFTKLTSMPLEFFSEKRKGDVISRVTSDVQEVEASIVRSLDALIKNPIMIIMNFIIMIAISWRLTTFVVILLPLSVFLVGRISSTLKRTSNKGQIQLGVILSQIEETLGGLRVIKAFRAEKHVETRFAEANNKFRRISNRLSQKRQSAHPVSELLGTLIIAIVLCYGGSLILSNNSSLSAENFIFYLLLFYSIVQPAKDFTDGIYSVQKGMASMDRINDILKAESSITDKADAIVLNDFNDKISYKNIRFKYTEDWVIKGINFDIKKGQTIALVGQSGSGKSTLSDLLPRFYDVTEGSIEIDGINIKDVTMQSLRSHMGYVNQDPILFNDTFFNNIAFGIENVTEEQVIAAAKVANAHQFIMETPDGYQTNVGDRGGRLSGGQRQRISIARAILANPAILILDEATSALDTESERHVQEALENLMKDRTTLVIAHRLSTIKNADCIYVINEGEIIEAGKHEELIAKKGTYFNLQEMQSF